MAIQDKFENVVVVCIGSEKISGDSLAPIVGDVLREKYNLKNFVYGTTERSVNGKNYAKYLDFVQKVHSGAKVLAVDAGLAAAKCPCDVKITNGVVPKKAVSGGGKTVGDVGIVGVVGGVTDNPLSALMSVSAVEVNNLAEKIAFVIFAALLF